MMTLKGSREFFTFILALVAMVAEAQTTTTRVNVGGSTFVDASGQTWSADVSCDGTTYARVADIAATVDDALYQTGRTAATSFSCTFTVPANTFYNVTLRFAETDPFYSTSSQERRFNVFINDVKRIPTLDVRASTRQFATAYDVTIPFVPSFSTQLTVMLTSVSGPPILSGIMVSSVQSFTTPATLDPTDCQFTKNSGSDVTGDLSTPGAGKVLTFVSAPLGVYGTNTDHKLRIYGSGTPESALITGGNCVPGATNCTIIVTTANAHSGAWTVASSSAGWTECSYVAEATGGLVQVAAGTHYWYDTVVIGNGSTAGQSTRNGLKIQGISGGVGPSEFTLANPTGAVKIVWEGSNAGTMLSLKGPYSNFHLQGITFDCHGTNTAATWFESNHNVFGAVSDIKTVNCSSYAIKEYAYPSPTGVYIGAKTIWKNIAVEAGAYGGVAASGFQIGAAAFGAAPNLDVAQSQYINVKVQCTNASGTGVGFNFRFTDVLDFYSSTTLYCKEPLKVTPVPTATQFPQAIQQYNATHIGNVVADPILIVDSSWTAVNGMMFWPLHTGDGERIPVHDSVKGMDDQGRIFGFPKFYGEGTSDGRGGVWAYNTSPSGPNNAVWNLILTSDTPAQDITYQFIANRAGNQLQLDVAGVANSFYVKKATANFYFGKGAALASLTRAALLAITPDASFTMYGCTDCNRDATCTGGGSGARAIYIAGAWACN